MPESRLRYVMEVEVHEIGDAYTGIEHRYLLRGPDREEWFEYASSCGDMLFSWLQEMQPHDVFEGPMTEAQTRRSISSQQFVQMFRDVYGQTVMVDLVPKRSLP